MIPSEITGLDDRHAYLKLGNHVARFDFDYIDLAGDTTAFIPRNSQGRQAEVRPPRPPWEAGRVLLRYAAEHA